MIWDWDLKKDSLSPPPTPDEVSRTRSARPPTEVCRCASDADPDLAESTCAEAIALEAPVMGREVGLGRAGAGDGEVRWGRQVRWNG